MLRFLDAAGRHGTLILPAGVAIGLAMQPLASLMRPLLMPAIFLILAIILTRLDLRAATRYVTRPAMLTAGLVWSIMIMPVIFAATLWLFPQSPGLSLILIIYATAPPNFAAAALAYIMGLDGALCVALIIGATALHPIITPGYVALFTEGAVAISPTELAVRLAALIGGAAVLAAILRHFLGARRRQDLGLAMDGANVLLMLVFVIGLMDGIPALIAARPVFSASIVALCFALHLVFNVITTLLFWRAGINISAAIGYCSGGRNIGIVMSVLGSAAPADAWLFFALLQFPIYTLPMILKPVYLRLLQDRT